MTTARQKEIQLAKLPYTPQVLLERCPTCAAPVGERCKRQYGGRLIVSGPHSERVKQSRRKDRR